MHNEIVCWPGCQDPWHVNPKVPLPPCTNVTYIRASYDRGPARESYGGWDMQFWDRQYMAERELADLSRDGKRCMSPCSQTYYNLEPSYLPKDKWVRCEQDHLSSLFYCFFSTFTSVIWPRVIKAEYGDKDEWVYAITFIYKTLLQEERFVIWEYDSLFAQNNNLQGGVSSLWFPLPSEQCWWICRLVLWCVHLWPHIYIWMDYNVSEFMQEERKIIKISLKKNYVDLLYCTVLDKIIN